MITAFFMVIWLKQPIFIQKVILLDSERFLKDKLDLHCSTVFSLLLEKSFYGLVQAARQRWEKMTHILMSWFSLQLQLIANHCLFPRIYVANQYPPILILYVE